MSRSADVALTNMSLSGNSATKSRGGGLYMAGGDFTATGVTIAGNSANTGGGGVYVTNTANDRINILSSTVSGNTSLQRAGGIYLRGIATVRNSTITNNSVGQASSINMAGGLMAGDGSQQLELDHTIIAGNFALSPGAPTCGFFRAH